MFHHWGVRSEKSFGLSGRCPPIGVGGLRDHSWPYWSWGVGFEHSLKVGRGSSSCCSVGKYHGLEVDVSFDWKPVECAVEQGDMGELGKVDKLQELDGTSREPSQQRVSVVQTGDDKCLD